MVVVCEAMDLIRTWDCVSTWGLGLALDWEGALIAPLSLALLPVRLRPDNPEIRDT